MMELIGLGLIFCVLFSGTIIFYDYRKDRNDSQ